MIRALIAALSWLDKRFPPKVTVTKETFDALLAREHARMKGATMMQGEINTLKERVTADETAIAAIKKVLMEAATVGAQHEKRRSAFVESGRFPAEPS